MGLLAALPLILFFASPSAPVTVDDDASLRAALRAAEPGDVIRIAPGTYAGGLWMERSGTAEAPIVIEAADAREPPLIEGGAEGLHLSGCSHVTLRNSALPRAVGQRGEH